MAAACLLDLLTGIPFARQMVLADGTLRIMTTYVRLRPLRTADAAEVGFTEAGGILQSVAEDPVEADMGGPHRRDQRRD